VLLVLAIGLTYPLLEGIVCWLIIRCRLPGFTLRRGLDAAFVGAFGNVVGLGAGAVPMESYYLYHCGQESWASAVEISAQWLLKMKTTTQVSASSTSRERIAFLREGCWGVLVCSMGQGSFHDTACSITQRNLVFVN